MDLSAVEQYIIFSQAFMTKVHSTENPKSLGKDLKNIYDNCMARFKQTHPGKSAMTAAKVKDRRTLFSFSSYDSLTYRYYTQYSFYPVHASGRAMFTDLWSL